MADTTTLAAQLQGETVSGDFLLQLAERNALPNHPALVYAGPVDAMNSTTRRIPQLGLMGYDLPAAPSNSSCLAWTRSGPHCSVQRLRCTSPNTSKPRSTRGGRQSTTSFSGSRTIRSPTPTS